MRGVVQGVGFRPAMYRLARTLELGGFVCNDRDGVLLEIEGAPDALSRFVRELEQAAPARARVASLESTDVQPRGERRFRIAESPAGETEPASAAIPVDLAPCDACLRELDDPGDRRYRYPFINCTDCGPRFTLVRSVPYDRERTTMDRFRLCARCRREYGDPLDRRFHAEPNACPDCGPEVRFVEAGVEDRGDPALRRAARRLREGAIVAVKGAGGFALAVDALDEASVTRLRERKHRPHKPFAVMARDLAHACAIAQLDRARIEALCSAARPILLAPRRPDAPLAESVAPRLVEVGVFLPPTPLQHLVAQDGPGLLVMTSGNLSEEPIAKDDDEALQRLGSIADAALLHDRPIRSRADDSVVRLIDGAPLPLRRARGYVPDAFELPVACDEPVLAVGGQMRNAVCLAHGDRAVLSQHVGDLSGAEAQTFFREAIAHLEELVSVRPAKVAHDLHPDYPSTRWALDSGLPRIAVQHHHAHVASCLVDHGRVGPVLGVAFDGTGYGQDGSIWGGEVLEASLSGYRRVAHLRPIALAGGEQAIRQPWRLALAALRDAGLGPEALPGVDPAAARPVEQLLERDVAVVGSTGAG
ncbi:MAG: carbamoyltransferase HypF, partial [Polyangiales bacterium]